MENKAQLLLAAYAADMEPTLSPIGIEFWLTKTDLTTVTIEAFWSHKERHVGHGTKALRQFCAMADDFGVSLKCSVRPLAYGEVESDSEAESNMLEALDKQALDAPALEAWYGRFGFCRVEGADLWNPELCRQANAASNH